MVQRREKPSSPVTQLRFDRLFSLWLTDGQDESFSAGVAATAASPAPEGSIQQTSCRGLSGLQQTGQWLTRICHTWQRQLLQGAPTKPVSTSREPQPWECG